jgi:hypothetical protein
MVGCLSGAHRSPSLPIAKQQSVVSRAVRAGVPQADSLGSDPARFTRCQGAVGLLVKLTLGDGVGANPNVTQGLQLL